MNTEYKYKINMGIGIGNIVAVLVSYLHWHSFWWAVLHGFFGWGYVIYFLIKYGF